MYSPQELELVGAIIGDGHIHLKKPKYYFGLTGNKITDKEYFEKMVKLIKTVWNKNTKPFESGRGLRIRVYSKKIVNRLINKFFLPYNFGKCYKVELPNFVLANFNLSKHVIRGIADTDGTIFVSDKKGSLKYPSIEITTASFILAHQIREILVNQDYQVAKVRSNKYKRQAPAYKVGLYGRNNLKKWIREIGFSNPVKLRKATDALQPCL